MIKPVPQELWLPRPMPVVPDLFIDRRTGTPLRWEIHVEIMDALPDTRAFLWESNHPKMVYGMPRFGASTMIRPLETAFRGINQVTGLPNAFELRDFVLESAGIH